jgi:hypothetical protein
MIGQMGMTQEREAIVYSVKVEEVHSGDDLILMVDLGIDNLYKRVRVRLAGVDCPDAYRAAPETEAGRVRDAVREITRGECRAKVHQQGGRGGWLVTLLYKTSEGVFTSINDQLVTEGHVYTSHIQKRA